MFVKQCIEEFKVKLPTWSYRSPVSLTQPGCATTLRCKSTRVRAVEEETKCLCPAESSTCTHSFILLPKWDAWKNRHWIQAHTNVASWYIEGNRYCRVHAASNLLSLPNCKFPHHELSCSKRRLICCNSTTTPCTSQRVPSPIIS